MSTQIEDIIQVNITEETPRITRVGFGTPILLGPHFVTPNRVDTFSNTADMLTAGFLSTDDLFKAAVKLTSQALSPSSFKIGRKLENVNEKQLVTFSAVPDGGAFTLALDGVDASSTLFSDNAAALKIDLETIPAITEVTVTGDFTAGFTIEFTGADINKAFSEFTVSANTLTSSSNPVTITIKTLQNGSAVETWTDALNNVFAADSDWYGLIATTKVKSEINELADVIETKIATFFSSTDDADVKTAVTTDVLSELQAKSLSRTAYLWSGDTANFPMASWVGGQLPKDPGTLTWKFKPLVGNVADVLTGTELANLKAKNGNFFETVAGVSLITSEAIMVNGDFIDVTRTVDWTQVRIAERIFGRLSVVDKIPFTNQGIDIVVSEVRAQLEEGADRGVFVRSSIIVTAPDVSEVSPGDKGGRILRDVDFSVQLAGAMHKIIINGKVTV
jgi:hypothetical protein